MDEEDITTSFVSLCTYYSPDEDELEDAHDSLVDVEKPKAFPNQDVHVDESNLDEFRAVFSTGSPEAPRGPDYTAVEFDITSDDRVHVHSYTEKEHLDTALSLHSDIIGVLGDVDITHCNVFYRIEAAFEELELSAAANQNIAGIRLVGESIQYSLHEEAENGGLTGMTYYEGDKEKLGSSEVMDFIEENINMGKTSILSLA